MVSALFFGVVSIADDENGVSVTEMTKLLFDTVQTRANSAIQVAELFFLSLAVVTVRISDCDTFERRFVAANEGLAPWDAEFFERRSRYDSGGCQCFFISTS